MISFVISINIFCGMKDAMSSMKAEQEENSFSKGPGDGFCNLTIKFPDETLKQLLRFRHFLGV